MLHIGCARLSGNEVSDNAVKKIQELEGVIAPVLATYEGPNVSQSSTKGTEMQNRTGAAARRSLPYKKSKTWELRSDDPEKKDRLCVEMSEAMAHPHQTTTISGRSSSNSGNTLKKSMAMTA